MKVSTCKNMDVEVEVDVSLDDCIGELLGMAGEEDAPRRKAQAVDGATKILARVAPRDIQKILDKNPGALSLIRERLQVWIDVLCAEQTNKD